MARFLHAADLHLDSPLRGLDQVEHFGDAAADAIRGASRRALENLVGLAIEEQVDFVLIAGDVYDGNWNDVKTGLFFVGQMARLKKANIWVFLIAGNHDAANRMTRSLPYPDNVTVFPHDQPQTIPLPELGIAIHGQSYGEQAEKRNLAAGYPAALPNVFNIGMLHTALDGRDFHDSYAPCALLDLEARDYDYWALGHVHKRESVNGVRRPRIEFPGNTQGRHIREAGVKGCLLVETNASQCVRTDFRPLDVIRWQRVSVDCSNAADLETILERVANAFDAVQGEAEARPVAVRVELTGSCPAHDCLLARPRTLKESIRAKALGCPGQIWVENISIQTARPNSDGDDVSSTDVLSEIAAVIDGLRRDPEGLASLLAEGDLEYLSRHLPTELVEPRQVEAGDEFASGMKVTEPAWAVGMLDRVQALLCDIAKGRRDES